MAPSDRAKGEEVAGNSPSLLRFNACWALFFVPYALGVLAAGFVIGAAFDEGRLVTANGEVITVVEPGVELGAIALLMICGVATVGAWSLSLPMCLANLADATRRGGRLAWLTAFGGLFSLGILGFVYFMVWGRTPLPSGSDGPPTS